ncbi:MAG TPA: VWA domain-containing protein, partial [Spirochaetia bacterium]|nr:VWA domain-containing protein [Spirochaetia bacterium]
LMELTVEDVLGTPVVGLSARNLFITEGAVPVKEVSVVLPGSAPRPLSVVILVEDSPELDSFDKELSLAIENIMGVLGPGTRITIVFAREEATVEAEFGQFDRERIQKLIQRRGDPTWKLDRGVRTAVTELLPERGRKAIVFLGSGTVRDTAFGLYSLQEVTAYCRNNGVKFYPVYLGASQKNQEIEYIMRETGGKSYLYFDPEGLKTLYREIAAAKSSTYVVRYTSPSQSDFGLTYIPLEVQVLHYKRSGRDESGYFGPLDND